MKTDLLVIGGGVTGLAAALAAAESGATVRLIDWGRNAGSAANAGSLHVQMQSRVLRLFPALAPGIEESLPLYVAAVREWERLDAALGGVELTRGGGLMVAETAAEMGFLEAKVAREAARGVASEMLDAAALAAAAPWLAPGLAGAALCRDEGKLNPLLANRRLRAAAAAAGVAFETARVETLEIAGGTVAARAEGAEWQGAQAILATAWGTPALTRPHGLDPPLIAEALHMNVTAPAAPAIRHLVQHAERPITLKQLAGGHVVIGGGWPARGTGDRPARVEAASLLGNLALAARLAPGIGGLRLIRSWAGLNTVADGKTLLGRISRAGSGGRLIVAVPGDAGYTLGPLVGRAAAALALGLAPPFDLAPFSPARFG